MTLNELEDQNITRIVSIQVIINRVFTMIVSATEEKKTGTTSLALTDTKQMTIVWDTTGIPHIKCNSITEIPGYYFHPQGGVSLRHSVRSSQESL